MSNPLVVFVNRNAWMDGSPLTLPAGWSQNGKLVAGLDGIRGQPLCLLLLDDDRRLPDCRHSNRDPSQPLPMILHANSKLHRDDPLVDSNHRPLLEWGRPVVQAKFSHRTEHADAIRDEIEALLRNHTLAPAFARKYHVEHELDILDALAAACVAALLDVESGAASEWAALLQQLPGAAVRAELDAAPGADWNQRLARVVKRADMLVSGISPAPAG